MTFLAPWALVAGIAAAMGALALHLVARQRPASYVLPTARFIPDRDTLVSRVATRPRDLVLLALRMLLLIAAGAAFARPVVHGARVPVARVVLLDRSGAVRNDREALARAREALGQKPDQHASLLITFDSVASAPRRIAALDSLRVRGDSAASRSDTSSHAVGSVSAALVAARRAASTLARLADSVELVLVSSVTTGELDAATDSIRALWPGAMRIVSLGATAPPAVPALERAIPPEDPLGPALRTMTSGSAGGGTRLVHAPFTAADTAYARRGGVVVRWDSIGAQLHADGLALGDDVIVAQLGRRAIDTSGIVRARWADGTAASREVMIGAGCLRDVGVVPPRAGDLTLDPGFQRIVRGLVDSCHANAGTALDSAAMRRLAGTGRAARASSFDGGEESSALAPWLLGVALLCSIADPIVRAVMRPHAENAT